MKGLKENRAASFVAVFAVYILSGAVGIAVYRALDFAWWLSLLLSDLAATVTTFIFSIIFSNASVYDPYWSVQPPVILIAYAIVHGLNAFGVLLISAVSFWAVRLTANWAYTFGSLMHQDWRYTMLKERTGAFYPVINFLGIHTVPTLVVYGCVLPAAYAIINGVEFTPLSLVFILISFGAAFLQGVADIQMHRFRRDRSTPFIRIGLWRHSRHPNYLGEILMWWGIALAVVVADTGAWYLALGALANTLLFLVVSIPMADSRQARKAGFAEYKSQTRMLLPIPKKLRSAK